MLDRGCGRENLYKGTVPHIGYFTLDRLAEILDVGSLRDADEDAYRRATQPARADVDFGRFTTRSPTPRARPRRATPRQPTSPGLPGR